MNYLLRLLLTLFTILCGTTISGASIQESHAGAVFEGETPFSAELVAPSSGGKVDDLAKQIRESGATVKRNPKTANQEGNVTLDFGSQGRGNLRVETHPIKGSGGQPVRHTNVETVTPKPNGKTKVKNLHILEDGTRF